MEKVKDTILFVLSFIWQLPQSIVGAVMLGFFKLFGGAEMISYKNLCYAYKAKNMNGGISLGNFVFLSEYSADKATILAHEQDGHTVDSKILGPLYLLVIGLPSILHAAFHTDCPCYYHFYTEKWANKHAGLKVVYYKNGGCYLKFDKEDGK